MWFLPLLVLGAVVFAISRSPRESVTTAPQLALPPPPGPISVLGELVRIGQVPPPTVILCAIAEAESIGRGDLASDIVRVFVAPVVYQHELMNAHRAPVPHPHHVARGRQAQPTYERGSCELPLPRSPQDEVQHAPLPAIQPAPALTTRHATDEEIRTMLNANPQEFIEMVKRGAPVIDVPVETMQRPMQPLPQHLQESSQPASPMGLPPEMVAQMQEAAGLHEAADQTLAMAPGSPLGNVPDGAWREFVTRLEREAPSFSSSRHVGQYRQRRERLADLGVDPNALGSAQAQRAALNADLADAHHHAVEGGLLADHLGRVITVPGHEGSETITLSGVLGVIQCAGLEGAVGWLEQPGDRKRYPHTTRAFLRSNGIF